MSVDAMDSWLEAADIISQSADPPDAFGRAMMDLRLGDPGIPAGLMLCAGRLLEDSAMSRRDLAALLHLGATAFLAGVLYARDQQSDT